MAVISNIGTGWSDAVTLAAAEFWQVQAGPVYLATAATDAPAALNDGLLLVDGQIVELAATEVVRYRSATGSANAALVRRAKA